jgi:hypothetical protein
MPLGLLRGALTQLALEPQQQREVLAGCRVADELALDLDHAVRSLDYELERSGQHVDAEVKATLVELNDTLTAPPFDELWDAASLDTHPVWAQARLTARMVLRSLR